MQANITTFIFDMGGVLPGHTMQEYLEMTAKDNEELSLFKEIVKLPLWLELDGGLAIEEAYERLCEMYKHKYDDTIKDFLFNFRQIEDPNPKMEQLVFDLKKKGFKVFLMSNVSYNYKKFFKYIKSISYMDDIWVSCERKKLKPDKEAFEDILQLFNLVPEECYFIDDSKSNIDAALECGIAGFHYLGDVDALRARIEKLI